MQTGIFKQTGMITASAVLALAVTAAYAEKRSDDSHDHDHDHAHEHANEGEKSVYKGYFEDEQVKERELSDWEGDWQSVYPLLQDGTLDDVMAHKAEHGDKTAEEYHAYYETGYETDVDHIVIDGDNVTFHSGESSFGGTYESGSYEILTYEKGNRGVRFIFEKSEGDEEAPDFIQFSDHIIAPQKSDHYHLYWGDNRAALLENVTNWPTYYPSELSAEQIVQEMTAH